MLQAHITGASEQADGSTTTSGSAAEAVSDSWQRCAADHHLNPSSGAKPNILTDRELKISSEPFAKVILQAREEIHRLYAIVRQQGYVVLLCNEAGVAIHHRGDEARAEEFRHWGIWRGGVWSEQVEGTNGIGTCIVEGRPVLVHRGQHYRARHARLSCAGAPIFDPAGRLAGVLDVSNVTEGAERTDPLALAATIATARAVEERIFREFFRHAWIIAAMSFDGRDVQMLLAVDEDQRILGADRVAREELSLSDGSLASGVKLSAVFEYSRSFFRRSSGPDVSIGLTRADTNTQWRALITPPLPSRVSRLWPEEVVHSQPRMAILEELKVGVPDVSRGGLSPAVLRHTFEYIEAHLAEKMSLDGLAAMAGLSVHHFARAFRQSVGMPPHAYLVQRRVARAEQMVRETALPLSDIALAVGFSDQSHLARRFRGLTGIAPSLARWAAR